MNKIKTAKILEIFFEYPDRKFTVRELSKMTRIPRASVHNYLFQLKKQRLVTKDNQSATNLLFKAKKTHYFIEKIIESGLVDFLVKNLNPSCIILFGSIRKGDSVKESDIDIFVESPIKKELILKDFEKKLNHKIQLFVKSNIQVLNPNLFNNIINGIKLYGSFNIK